jgi:hypothetical protein
MPDHLDRRDLLKLGAAGLGLAAVGGALGCRDDGVHRSARPSLGAAPDELFRTPPMETVRMGFVGVGLQGGAHVQNFLKIDGVEIKAICDIDVPRMEEVIGWVEADGRPRPAAYGRGETDFVRMCQTEELDLVFTATPWEWHVPVCTSAMENDKHAATEVPAAYTIDDCWKLVEWAERFGKHCVMMENVNYGPAELMVLNMVRQGMFGEILHGEGGYMHDLRAIKFEDAHEGLWRRAHSMERNGNLYPTHGLGPIANCMNINRGDRFDHLVSMSGPSRGLQQWAEENYPAGSPQRQEQFVLGDVNVSFIKTSNGRTIYVGHDTNLPRPYSRMHMVQGTKGIFQGYPNRVHIEGRSPGHDWEPMEDYYDEFQHPLWRRLQEESEGARHGGMDFVEDWRLIECLRQGTATDMNVYDAAALSAVTPLSEWSVANGSRPIEFPDFTRGKWQTYPELGIVS